MWHSSRSNLKTGTKSINEDDEADLDDLSTVMQIKHAIESTGSTVVLMEANDTIVTSLTENTVDIVFNIAEGIKGRGREAQIPALLNLLNILAPEYETLIYKLVQLKYIATLYHFY